jgi:hypothetical protein
MNPVQQRILERLQEMPPECAALAGHAGRYARFCSSIAIDDTLQIGHTPWRAPEAYTFSLFVPAKKTWFQRFRSRTGRQIPQEYRNFLLGMNGCWAYGLALFGLPPSLQRDPPLMDRSRVQPLDLDAANRYWAREFKAPDDEFHFGGRSWSDAENVGYFWSESGLHSRRKSGEVVGQWGNLSTLLTEELAAAEGRLAQSTPDNWRI